MTRPPIAEMASIGVAVPPGVLTNADLTHMLDTSDEWIVERTGIRERHIAKPDQSVAMLSHEASEKALSRAGLTQPISMPLFSQPRPPTGCSPPPRVTFRPCWAPTRRQRSTSRRRVRGSCLRRA